MKCVPAMTVRSCSQKTWIFSEAVEPFHLSMLTTEQIRHFHEVGFIVLPALFDRDEIDRMQLCFESLEEMAAELNETGMLKGSQFVLGEKDSLQVIKRVVWAGGSQPYLLQIGEDPRLTVPAAQLLGAERLEQLLSQAHFKRPNDGVVFGWHQDIQHRDKGNGTWTDINGRGSFVQSLIVLDDMTPDSGPLQFIPGSSQWGPVDFGDHDYDGASYTPRTPPQFQEHEAVTIMANAGDTLLFGPYTAHASFENTSDSYRRVFINGYASPGANNRAYPGAGAGRTIAVPETDITV